MEAREMVFLFSGEKFVDVVKDYTDPNTGLVHLEWAGENPGTKDLPPLDIEHREWYVVGEAGG